MAMLETETADGIFADAYEMQSEALVRLEAGDVRDAAEKAWCATLRATAAMLLAETGEPMPISPMVTRLFGRLSRERGGEWRRLYDIYRARQRELHGDCFYIGECGEMVPVYIEETAGYIADCEKLAGQ